MSRGDEDDVAAAALDHRRARTPGPAGARRPRSRSSSRVNRSESTSTIVPGRDRAGVADHDLDVAEVGGDRLGERRDRLVVGEVERVHDGLAAVRRGSAAATSSSLSVRRRARARPGSRPRPAPARSRRRCRSEAPVTTAGRRSGWAYFSLAISAPPPGIGTEAKPRTLTECTRAAARRGRPRPSRTRSTSAVSAIRASSRARLAPRQKCRPPPKRQDLRELVLVAEDVVVVGAAEDPLVAVGRAEAEQQLRALRRDRAVQLDVLEQVAREQLAGGVEAQRLLDPRARPGPVSPAPSKTCRELVGVPGQVEERVAEQLGRGLVAGHDHQEEEGDDVLVAEPVAVDLGLDQRAGQVVARPAPPLVDHVLVVADQPQRRPRPRPAGRRGRRPRGAPRCRPGGVPRRGPPRGRPSSRR